MPKVTQEYRDHRRDEIADAALRSFARHGFANTSMSAIIDESGLSAGAIYGHFASKQQIMIAAAGRVMQRRGAELDEMAGRDDVPSPGEVLARLLHGTSHEFDAPGLLIQLWGEAVTDAAIREVVRGYLVFLRSAFREYFLAWARRGKGLQGAAAEAWVEAILPVAIGIGQGYMFQRALLPDFDEDEYLRVAGELLAAR